MNENQNPQNDENQEDEIQNESSSNEEQHPSNDDLRDTVPDPRAFEFDEDGNPIDPRKTTPDSKLLGELGASKLGDTMDDIEADVLPTQASETIVDAVGAILPPEAIETDDSPADDGVQSSEATETIEDVSSGIVPTDVIDTDGDSNVDSATVDSSTVDTSTVDFSILDSAVVQASPGMETIDDDTSPGMASASPAANDVQDTASSDALYESVPSSAMQTLDDVPGATAPTNVLDTDQDENTPAGDEQAAGALETVEGDAVDVGEGVANSTTIDSIESGPSPTNAPETDAPETDAPETMETIDEPIEGGTPGNLIGTIDDIAESIPPLTEMETIGTVDVGNFLDASALTDVSPGAQVPNLAADAVITDTDHEDVSEPGDDTVSGDQANATLDDVNGATDNAFDEKATVDEVEVSLASGIEAAKGDSIEFPATKITAEEAQRQTSEDHVSDSTHHEFEAAKNTVDDLDQPNERTIDDAVINQTLDSVDLPVDLTADDRGTINTVDSIAQTLDSVDLPASPIAKPDAEDIDPAVDSTLDSVGAAFVDPNATVDDGTDAINATLDSVDIPGSVRSINVVNAETQQTLDSVDVPTGGIGGDDEDEGTVNERAIAATMDSSDSVHLSGSAGTSPESLITGDSATRDSGLAPDVVERMKNTWEGSVADVTEQTSLEAKQSGRASDDGELVLKNRTFRRQKDLGKRDADYEILAELGKGGMGIVYSARQASISRRVAVKMQKGEATREKVQRIKFLSEAVVTGDLEHPNIVPIYDVGMDEKGALFYAMKQVHGTPWNKIVQEKSLHENLEILLKVADAMGFAHSRKVIHRDLKPENVMLGAFGEVLVMDWGLAIPSDGRKIGGLKQTMSMGGTPAYMAPEMAAGPFDRIGTHSDTYLLGAILYEIITGKPPHTGRDVMKCLFAAAKNEIQPTKQRGELLDVALRAMHTDTSKRHQSVQEFQDAIRLYLSHSESIKLSDRAMEEWEHAQKSKDYQDFARARFGFEEAYELWDGNSTARNGFLGASLDYALAAKDQGDFDLALQLLDDKEEPHVALKSEVQLAKQERESRARKITVLKYTIAGVVGIALMAVSASLFAVSRQYTYALEQQSKAEAATKVALVEKQKAEDATKEAVTQRDRADEEKEKAILEKAKAEIASFNAELSAIEAQMAQKSEAVEREKAVVARNEAVRQEANARIASFEAEISEIEAVMSRNEAVKQQAKAQISSFAAEISAIEAVMAQKNEAAERAIAVQAKEDAIVARNEAVRQQGIAQVASFESDISAIQAQMARVAAEVATNEAIKQKGIAEYQAYVALIGLAAAKIEENAYDGARELLAAANPVFREWEWKRLNHLCEQNEAEYVGEKRVEAVAYEHPSAGDTPKRFVIGTWDGFVQVWDMEDKKHFTKQLEDCGDRVYAVAFSKDNQWVAIGCDQRPDPANPNAGYLKLWNPQTAEIVVIPGHRGAVTSVEFSTDGQRLLTSSYDGTAKIWDIQSKSQLSNFLASTTWLWDAAFSPDQRKVVTASHDGEATVWDVNTGEKSPPFYGHVGPVYSASFSPDGRHIVTGGHDKRVLIWNWENIGAYDFKQHIATFSDPDRAYDESKIRATQTQSDFTPFEGDSIDDRHTAAVRVVRFSADGNRVISAGHDNTIKIWRVNDYTLEKTLRGHGSWVRDIDVAADGLSIISAGFDDKFPTRTWNIDRYVERRVLRSEVLAGHANELLSVSISDDGEVALTASHDRTARSWRISDGAQLNEFVEGHQFLTKHAGFFDDDKKLYTAAVDNSVRIWDVEAGVQLYEFKGTGLNAVAAISPDGRWLATGGALETERAESQFAVQVWSLDDAAKDKNVKPKFRLAGRSTPITAAAFGTHEGRLYLVAGEQSGAMGVWDMDALLKAAESQEEPNFSSARIKLAIDAIHGHHRRVETMAFVPGTKQFVSADRSAFALLWTIGDDGVSLTKEFKHPAGLSAIAVNAKRNELYTASTDGLIRGWSLASGQQLWDYSPQSAYRAVATRLQQRMNEAKVSRAELAQKLGVAVSEPDIVALLNKNAGYKDIDRDLLSRVAGALDVTVAELALPQPVSLSLTPGADKLMFALGGDNTIRTLNLTGQKPTAANETLYRDFGASEVSGAVISQSGAMVATVGGAEAQLWKLEDPTAEIIGFNPHGSIASANFNSDRKYVVTASWDKSARIWDAQSGSDLMKLVGAGGHTDRVNDAVFSADDDFVLTAGSDGVALLWSIDVPNKKSQVVTRYEHGDTEVRSAEFSADGSMVLTASKDGVARVFNRQDGKELWRLVGEKGVDALDAAEAGIAALRRAVFSPNGDRVITASENNTAVIWELPNDKHNAPIVLHRLAGHTAAVTAVAFSPQDGKRVLTASEDYTAKLWDAGEGKEILSLKGHAREVTDVAFSNNGQHIITASKDSTAIIWLTEGRQDENVEVSTPVEAK